MRKCLVLAVTFCLTACLVSPASAQSNAQGLYFSAKAGFGMAQVDDLDFDLGQYSFNLNAEEDTDTVPVYGLAMGWDFYHSSDVPIRLEFEFMHMNKASFKWQENVTLLGNTYNEEFDGDIKADTLFVNLYYDFRNESIVTPFVQGGFGLANVNLDVHWVDNGNDMGSESENSSNLGFTVGGGIGLAATDNLTLDVGYRFVYLGPASVDSESIDVKVETTVWRHDLIFGLRYTF